MIRLGKNTSTLTRSVPTFVFLVLGISILSFLLLSCSYTPPKNYYIEFALMEEWGEHNRQQSNRQLGDVVVHPEESEPLTIAFEVGYAPRGLIEFIPVAEEFRVIPEVVPPIEKTKVIISIQERALETVFRQEKIHMVHYRAKNGRLTGKSNVVQINFVPASFSDRSIYAEFLMITAIVHGAQLEKDTVDVVKCVVEDDNGSPVMSLEGNILTYLKYKEALIEKQEWENQLQIVKY